MKILKKIKNALISIGVAIISFPNKIFAIMDPQPIYAPTPLEISGKTDQIWLVMIRILIIPIAILIGMIVYLKKSKSSKKKKACVVIGIIIIVMLLYFIIDKVMSIL